MSVNTNTQKKLFVEACARPFLKWAGGKSQLLDELLPRVPKFSGDYYEPFVGGGALFFALQPANACLSDVNAELISAYQIVRDRVDQLIRALRQLRYNEELFYEIRNADRLPSFRRWSDVRKTARLIYLNKTCYNGLYRVNSRGEFNTPFGKYSNPKILDEENLRACSTALQKASLQESSFDYVGSSAQKGDFVYFDPPYVPLSETAYFTSYTSGGFDLEMQEKLLSICGTLDRRGVRFMVSNSSTEFTRKLWRGFRMEEVLASRAINCKGEKRAKIFELIVTNY